MSAIVPVVIHPDFTIGVDVFAGLPFCHVDVRRWGPGVLRRIRVAMVDVRAIYGETLHALHRLDDAKHAKFCSAVGFEPSDITFTDPQGVAWVVYQKP